jgi:pimeloyl-ACP methyl ester carboxylesterase
MGQPLSTDCLTVTEWSLPTTPGSVIMTLDRIVEYVERFTDAVGLERYSVVVQDYGGPVGMTLAVRRPARLSALVVKNAVCHEDGFGHCGKRESLLVDRASRQRHVANSPHPDQADLFYDYRTNIASYRAWQGRLREDATTAVGPQGALRPFVPGGRGGRPIGATAQVHVIDARTLPLDEAPDVVASLTDGFLARAGS